VVGKGEGQLERCKAMRREAEALRESIYTDGEAACRLAAARHRHEEAGGPEGAAPRAPYLSALRAGEMASANGADPEEADPEEGSEKTAEWAGRLLNGVPSGAGAELSEAAARFEREARGFAAALANGRDGFGADGGPLPSAGALRKEAARQMQRACENGVEVWLAVAGRRPGRAASSEEAEEAFAEIASRRYASSKEGMGAWGDELLRLLRRARELTTEEKTRARKEREAARRSGRKPLPEAEALGLAARLVERGEAPKDLAGPASRLVTRALAEASRSLGGRQGGQARREGGRGLAESQARAWTLRSRLRRTLSEAIGERAGKALRRFEQRFEAGRIEQGARELRAAVGSENAPSEEVGQNALALAAEYAAARAAHAWRQRPHSEAAATLLEAGVRRFATDVFAKPKEAARRVLSERDGKENLGEIAARLEGRREAAETFGALREAPGHEVASALLGAIGSAARALRSVRKRLQRLSVKPPGEPEKVVSDTSPAEAHSKVSSGASDGGEIVEENALRERYRGQAKEAVEKRAERLGAAVQREAALLRRRYRDATRETTVRREDRPPQPGRPDRGSAPEGKNQPESKNQPELSL
jgi:hypothetical protein